MRESQILSSEFRRMTGLRSKEKASRMNTSSRVRRSAWIIKASSIYFALVFGTGFPLGMIRVLLVVPRLGVRAAELLEQPLMLVAVLLAARWIVRRFGTGLTAFETLSIGIFALGTLLLAEIAVGSLLQPNRVRDPISSAAYFVMLGLFAMMPWLVSSWKASR